MYPIKENECAELITFLGVGGVWLVLFLFSVLGLGGPGLGIKEYILFSCLPINPSMTVV